MTVEQENQYLKEEVCMLKSKLDDVDRRRVSAEAEASSLSAMVRELQDKVKFLEGQVDAYQYCLNSRFLR